MASSNQLNSILSRIGSKAFYPKLILGFWIFYALYNALKWHCYDKHLERTKSKYQGKEDNDFFSWCPCAKKGDEEQE